MRRQDAIERREKRQEIGRARTLPELLALAKKEGLQAWLGVQDLLRTQILS